MDTFYKVTSLNKNKNCYNIKPFNYNDLEGEINSITKRPILKDEINTIKNAFIRINNNNNSEIIKCCDTQNKYELSVDGKLNNNYDLELFNLIKNIYPLIRIFKDLLFLICYSIINRKTNYEKHYSQIIVCSTSINGYYNLCSRIF